VSAVVYLVLCVYIKIFAMMCVCDWSAGVTLVPRSQDLDAITARSSLSHVTQNDSLPQIIEVVTISKTVPVKVPSGNCIETTIAMWECV